MTSRTKPASKPTKGVVGDDAADARDERDPASSVRTSAGASLEPALAALVAEVRAGKATGESVVEAMVSRAVESRDASALDDDGRLALAAHLRAMLLGDPAFSRVLADLVRAR